MKKILARLLVLILAVVSILPAFAEAPFEEVIVLDELPIEEPAPEEETAAEADALLGEAALLEEDIEVVTAPEQDPAEAAPIEADADAPLAAQTSVKEFKLTKDDKTSLNVGEQLKIVLDGKTISEVKSSKTKVATVSKDGLVKAVAEGKAKITVKTTDKKKLKLTVTVIDPYKPESVSFAKASITMNVGESLTLAPVLKPSTAKTTCTWKSSKAKVATVSANGVVKALAEGKAKVTVQTANKKDRKSVV